MHTRSGFSLFVGITLAGLYGLACAGGSESSEARSDYESAAAAVVQIIARDSSGEEVWIGSGTFIDASGLILTNAHVVDERDDEYVDLAVAITASTDLPPTLSFLAEIVAIDYELDLAVIAIVSNLDGEAVDDRFPIVPIGDSDGLEIGDDLRIIGYPAIGGETITLTEGATSGFLPETGIEGRAWIKTDAAVLAGSSGGLALHDGLLVGLPSIVGAGAESDEVIDCDLIFDTNGDELIDEGDTCLPTGGFLNGLRPINLALPLIEAAQSGTEYISPY